MDFGGPFFVLSIIAISTFGWLANNWIRARHGYSLEDEWGGKTERKDSDEAKQLRAENGELRALLGKVDKRMQVLERIVTDKGYSVAAEIEALRDERSNADSDAGVPLDVARKEKV
ncbi:hypothetical protein [Qipengyuania sp. RANM35]|uniref:hypothetical protein n=1 Tax=Qipengyuania sp. RANM35 TaxID=3068635 RepID=UPI0034DADC03